MKNQVKSIFLIFFGLIITSCGNNKKEQAESTEAATTADTTTVHETDIQKLSNSPRHHEWVTLSHGDREYQAFVAYPETDSKTKAVVLIHENRGLNDWARLTADRLAAEGFLVIAPDLISNTKGNKLTTDFENPDAAREAIYDLDPEQVTADLDAAYRYVKNDVSSTGEVAVIGFCWGGSQTFRYATNNQEISSAHVFYGTAPEDSKVFEKISAPVYGYYGGEDNRVNATIEQTEEYMEAAGKTYEYEIYEGAGHAFMRSAHRADSKEAENKAHDAAWNRLLKLLRG